MFYKLSNTSTLPAIEDEFNITFKYPNVYEPKAIINGLCESNLPIITSETPSAIDYAIWGLLPEGYDDDWQTFQGFTNTLNTNIDDANFNKEIYSKSLDERRCLIIVNGYFTSKLVDGKLQAHHIHLKNHEPFCIAGIFNKIQDGFLTCSILVTNAGVEYNHIPNLGNQKPLILKRKDHSAWLDSRLKIKDLRSLIETHDRFKFTSHPIKDQFYKNTKLFKRIINNDHYQDIIKVYRN
ncbi:SOS response-associated peptidase [Psychroserpens damuponensis]|uniref:SOS response-associated peptidase n=1 Tax=Psychroserpens damuponensis TaxID=943936 RepID=UPI000AD78C6C|nr:SOS response-associated peptidase family protein [Psychroserpens damuponensis]